METRSCSISMCPPRRSEWLDRYFAVEFGVLGSIAGWPISLEVGNSSLNGWSISLEVGNSCLTGRSISLDVVASSLTLARRANDGCQGLQSLEPGFFFPFSPVGRSSDFTLTPAISLKGRGGVLIGTVPARRVNRPNVASGLVPDVLI
jgi:hypothetical protein